MRLMSVAKRIVSSMVSLVSPGRPRMNVPWILMAQFVAIPGELAGYVDTHALLDVYRNLLIAAFIANQPTTGKPLSFSHLQVSRGTLALALHDQVTAILPSSRAIAQRAAGYR